MKQDECLDYSENLIKIKQLLTNIEQCVLTVNKLWNHWSWRLSCASKHET